jgi:hypothetical protein
MESSIQVWRFWTMQQISAGIFHQIEHMLEAAVAAIVGIGHFALVKALAVVGQPLHALLLGGRGDAARSDFVGAVHHQHQIESVEILLRQLPRTLSLRS